MAGEGKTAVDPIRPCNWQNMKFVSSSLRLAVFSAIAFFCQFGTAFGQSAVRESVVRPGTTIVVTNRYGRVDAAAPSDESGSLDAEAKPEAGKILLTVTPKNSEGEIRVVEEGGKLLVEVVPSTPNKRIDISLVIPSRSKLFITTLEGEIRVSGDLESIEARTDTGTIAANVPTANLKYRFLWNSSRPRFLSDIKLADVKERSAGKFEIKGAFKDETSESTKTNSKTELPIAHIGTENAAVKDKVKKKRKAAVSLDLFTERGIILLNVPPNEVTGDLRERPLTEAAKAIIRSGDSLLMEAIRRAAPKYFGDYARTLPPVKLEPTFAAKSSGIEVPFANIKEALVRVVDLDNRAISGLTAGEFEVTENNVHREIVSVEPAAVPVNLVLLLDVSGSVDNYVNFIRKAARSFVETVDSHDRISIIIFNDDVKVLSGFTTDKRALSESLDTFDAGGATAYYDSLAYVLADTLRPLKGERTAVVVLTDGDDNRSFLPFDSMLASIQESGALIYPLYVPSELIAASAKATNGTALDSLRSRYLNGELTSKAQSEGPRLAKASGGVYYPITQLSQIQTAYNDIAAQLRTAYSVKFRSETINTSDVGPSPKLKIKVNRANAYVSIGKVTKVE